ncbi:TetR family transcriptional regulator [Streptomyces montanus]|uniref:TetR family transcriptional regulator n=2 Tax=Streptomyces montanus TaxID=2580423 RepID=A0A5R9FTA0_9ACTN|nr:TetR family transcriptional regulator [Streptomyces montanus]
MPLVGHAGNRLHRHHNFGTMNSQIKHSNSRTFTQEARRAQIVQAAIETIAELGCSKASFDKITRHAGLSSTGMISYHFSGKTELFGEIINTIHGIAGEVSRSHINNKDTYREKVGAYIQANFDFVSRYPAHAKALAEIVALKHCRGIDGIDSVERQVMSVDRLVDLLEEGRSAGEFGTFDSRTMAMVIRTAIDAFFQRHFSRTELDLDRCARQLTDIFDRCTRPADRPGARSPAEQAQKVFP